MKDNLASLLLGSTLIPSLLLQGLGFFIQDEGCWDVLHGSPSQLDDGEHSQDSGAQYYAQAVSVTVNKRCPACVRGHVLCVLQMSLITSWAFFLAKSLFLCRNFISKMGFFSFFFPCLPSCTLPCPSLPFPVLEIDLRRVLCH